MKTQQFQSQRQVVDRDSTQKPNTLCLGLVRVTKMVSPLGKFRETDPHVDRNHSSVRCGRSQPSSHSSSRYSKRSAHRKRREFRVTIIISLVFASNFPHSSLSASNSEYPIDSVPHLRQSHTRKIGIFLRLRERIITKQIAPRVRGLSSSQTESADLGTPQILILVKK
jgi:hypothetical protein